ncbi:MAG: lycopene cyclase domain-containing protein [Microbacteriaceae bacterium]|nr:lycopene cyclase domain-containing protein [Microbacteriaceae bacterium]
MTYWALNAFFLGAVAVVAVLAILRARRLEGNDTGRGVAGRGVAGRGVAGRGVAGRGVAWPAVGITAAVLLGMTAVFDNIMIGVGLVGYDESLISGAFIGIAPLEDFAYTVAAVVLLPSLWALLPVAPGSASARTDSAPASPSPSGGDA